MAHGRRDRGRRATALLVLGLLASAPLPTRGAPGSSASGRSDASSAAADAPAGRRSVAFFAKTMGTYAHLVIVTEDSAGVAPRAEKAMAELARLDSLMSNWTTTSEVARINRMAASAPTVIDPEVATVVESSLAACRASDGAFDITVEPLIRLWGFLGGPKRVPSPEEVREAMTRVGIRHLRYDPVTRALSFDREGVRIDLGGIAKGYAVDAAARVLEAEGVTHALVDLSGNMMALGAPEGARAWKIGIRDPRGRMPYFARLDLSPGEAISTSGKYEQYVAQDGRTYGHIMDPRTGWPAEGLISVTVVSASAFTCDTWDTPLFVLGGDAARRKATERGDFAAILVRPGRAGVDTVEVESSLLPRFALEPAAAPLFVVRSF